jgi:N-acetylglucosamine repressor
VRKINTSDFKRATRTTSRHINRQIALNLIHEHQPISRADLARRMELNRGTVTSLVNELLREKVVIEGTTTKTARGRRPKSLFVRTRDRLVLGIDVRYSRTYLMLSDLSGRQIALENFETVFSPADLVAELAERIGHLVQRFGVLGSFEGIGLVVPGIVDPESGRVLHAPQLGRRDVEIRDQLESATGMSVSIEHASIACALAQMWLGEPGSYRHDEFVYVTISDGVGAAIVSRGVIIRGAHHASGEIGHVPINLGGPRCLCGSRGCLEAYTSNLATLSRYLGRELSLTETRERLQQEALTVPELITRARTGDERARAAIEQTGRYLGVGLAMIVNSLNPARIIVGGEITEAWEMIEPHIRRAVRQRALTPATAATPITPELTISYPRLRGATALLAAPHFAAPRVA